ncbi:MAG: hypothetical protein JJD97_10300 [Gemmatimonadaceae bacterium]|nr:hypothetical protein [Gemmatimonadaceae bacterium]
MPNPDERLADAELSRLLASIDHPMPRVSAAQVIMRARARSGRRSMLLAAAAVLAVASVATATVPGSFVRRYLHQLVGARSAAPSPAPAAQPASEAASRGIAFTPGAEVEIDFRALQATGVVAVRWADARTVLLTQSGSSGDAHYALTPTGVIVDNGGSAASYTLVLPRSLERARVRIAGGVVLAKEGDTVSCAGARDDVGSCEIAMGGKAVK